MMKSARGVIIIVILVGGCVNQEYKGEPATVDEPPKMLMGVSLSPRSFQSSDFTDFFEKADQAGEIVSWAGSWSELSTDNGGPKVVTELAAVHGYIPLVEAQFFIQSSGQLSNPLNEETSHAYITGAAAFAELYTPEYLAFGIEVNVLYEKSPDDFDEFVTLYSDVYDAVKAGSPDTKVFTIFQLERLKGLHGGLFGGKNDPAQAQWHLIDKFRSDIAAFTTYPGLIYRDPSEIPADYYSEISLHTDKSVAFTEIGWHSTANILGWESSEAEQAEFVTTFFRLIEDLDVELAVWSFLYDQDTYEPFASMGLCSADGMCRPAWDAWIGEVHEREGDWRVHGNGVWLLWLVHHINSRSFILTQSENPMIMWSRILMPTRLPHTQSSRVNMMSCSEGSGSPEGWLCTKMIDVAPAVIAGRKTSVGWTDAWLDDPNEILW
jgi:hypothetical protein